MNKLFSNFVNKVFKKDENLNQQISEKMVGNVNMLVKKDLELLEQKIVNLNSQKKQSIKPLLKLNVNENVKKSDEKSQAIQGAFDLFKIFSIWTEGKKQVDEDNLWDKFISPAVNNLIKGENSSENLNDVKQYIGDIVIKYTQNKYQKIFDEIKKDDELIVNNNLTGIIESFRSEIDHSIKSGLIDEKHGASYFEGWCVNIVDSMIILINKTEEKYKKELELKKNGNDINEMKEHINKFHNNFEQIKGAFGLMNNKSLNNSISTLGDCDNLFKKIDELSVKINSEINIRDNSFSISKTTEDELNNAASNIKKLQEKINEEKLAYGDIANVLNTMIVRLNKRVTFYAEVKDYFKEINNVFKNTNSFNVIDEQENNNLFLQIKSASSAISNISSIDLSIKQNERYFTSEKIDDVKKIIKQKKDEKFKKRCIELFSEFANKDSDDLYSFVKEKYEKELNNVNEVGGIENIKNSIIGFKIELNDLLSGIAGDEGIKTKKDTYFNNFKNYMVSLAIEKIEEKYKKSWESQKTIDINAMINNIKQFKEKFIEVNKAFFNNDGDESLNKKISLLSKYENMMISVLEAEKTMSENTSSSNFSDSVYKKSKFYKNETIIKYNNIVSELAENKLVLGEFSKNIQKSLENLNKKSKFYCDIESDIKSIKSYHVDLVDFNENKKMSSGLLNKIKEINGEITSVGVNTYLSGEKLIKKEEFDEIKKGLEKIKKDVFLKKCDEIFNVYAKLDNEEPFIHSYELSKKTQSEDIELSEEDRRNIIQENQVKILSEGVITLDSYEKEIQRIISVEKELYSITEDKSLAATKDLAFDRLKKCLEQHENILIKVTKKETLNELLATKDYEKQLNVLKNILLHINDYINIKSAYNIEGDNSVIEKSKQDVEKTIKKIELMYQVKQKKERLLEEVLQKIGKLKSFKMGNIAKTLEEEAAIGIKNEDGSLATTFTSLRSYLNSDEVQKILAAHRSEWQQWCGLFVDLGLNISLFPVFLVLVTLPEWYSKHVAPSPTPNATNGTINEKNDTSTAGSTPAPESSSASNSSKGFFKNAYDFFTQHLLFNYATVDVTADAKNLLKDIDSDLGDKLEKVNQLEQQQEQSMQI